MAALALGQPMLACAAAGQSAPMPAPGQAPDSPASWTVHGRVNLGAVYRLEDADARLPFALNGAAAGVPALNGTGANADDANLNFRRHDAVSRAVTGRVDIDGIVRDSMGAASSTRVRLGLKAWRDQALRNDARSWGSAANNYAAGAPLSDAGAPPLSRFSGVVVGEAWLEQSGMGGTGGAGGDGARWRWLARAGQQTLDWGANSAFGGGLEVLTPRDLPAMRRAGAAADGRVPVPMLFASVGRSDPGGPGGAGSSTAVELFYQTHFRPNALDMCGTFYAVNDYSVNGCDKVMSGTPVVSDRERVARGAYLKRLPTPKPEAAQFGVALYWQLAAQGLRLGAYHAQYTSRAAVPSLRKSSRTGPAYLVGDPDGKNLAFFTEYPEAIRIDALTFTHRGGLYGELSRRPNQPLLFGPGDGLPPFINPTVPALLRADASAVAPGGLFHAYDRYAMWQGQLGWQQAPGGARFGGLGVSVEAVVKHIERLPDQALRRYGRSDVFGAGPVNGVCNVNMTVPALQCSQDGYVSRNAAAWRARVEAPLPLARWLPATGWHASASVGLVYDVRGWSADALINQGRRSANLGLRFDYRQRYLIEAAWLPVWGGAYNALADRDTLAIAVGVKF